MENTFLGFTLSEIGQYLPIFMVAGIAIIIASGYISYIFSGILGIGFWSFIYVMGSWVYQQGGVLGIVTFELSSFQFSMLVIALAIWNLFTAFVGLKRRRKSSVVIDASQDHD